MIVKEKEVKDYLTKSKIGEYAINPYIGCPHQCRYCYASFMKRFTNHKEAWGEFIDIKRCNKKIDIKKIEGKNVFISSVTDCYNPYEEKYCITRSILLKQMRNLSVAVSINTLAEDFRSDMDKASSIKERLEVLKTLHKNGIYTILFMSPIFIGITNWKGIIEQTKEYINEYWFEDLNLRGSYKYDILSYIKENYPKIYPTFENIYLKGKKQELINMDNEIRDYCNFNKIHYSAYFHHEEVIKNRENKN